MLPPTSLVLLPLVVFVSLTVETLGASGQYAVANLHNGVAKDVMVKLQREIDDLESSFENYAVELQANNELLPAVKAYRATYESAKHSTCAGEAPPEDNDDDLILSYIEDCQESLPTDDMIDYNKKVKEYMAQVKQIDDDLKEECKKDKKACKTSTTTAEEQLKGVLTPELDADFKSQAKTILSKFETNLKECFVRDSSELVNDLHEGVKTINECLAKDKKPAE